jgi:palmitoyltransferase
MRNQTGIENWILRKARDRNHRRKKAFIYPYDLGFKENLRQVFNWRETFNVIGDGFTWPIVNGTDEYALTREQIEQKKEKRQRTVRYEVIKAYKGSFFTLRYGLRTCICIPCSDEFRMPIEKGDYILVTRWETYWLYGERIIANDMNKNEGTNNRRSRRPRGWFPRCCVYEAFRIEDLWSGKIEPDSDVVKAQFANFGPEGYDENEEENNLQPEENQSDDTTSVSTSTSTSASSTSSKKLRQRKVRQEN